MGWLAVLAGVAYGLNAGISAMSVRRDPGGHASPPGGAWAALAFAVFAVPPMLAAAGVVQGGADRDDRHVGLRRRCRRDRHRRRHPGLRVASPGRCRTAVQVLLPLGFLAFHVWVAILSVAILMSGALPAGLGWLGIVVIGGFVAGMALSVTHARRALGRRPGVVRVGLRTTGRGRRLDGLARAEPLRGPLPSRRSGGCHPDDDVMGLGVALDIRPNVHADRDHSQATPSSVVEREPHELLADAPSLVRWQHLSVDQREPIASDDVVDEAREVALVARLVPLRVLRVDDRQSHAHDGTGRAWVS